MSTTHTPSQWAFSDGNHSVDCSCGDHEGGLFSTEFGARVAFLDHVVSAIATEADWPETYSVDGDDTYIGDAT